MGKKKAAPDPKAGFLADILAHPADDTPRLIFADWLDEHGPTESYRARAELIRLQCRMARMEEDSPERLDLEPREKELLAQHQTAWQQELPKWVSRGFGVGSSYRRGFVAVVRTNAESFTYGAYQLFQVTPLERADLELPGNAETILDCPLLEKLVELGLEGLKPPDFALLADSPRLGNLRCLRLRTGYEARLGDLLPLAGSPHLTQLTELELEQAYGSDASEQELAVLAATQLARVTSLRLRRLWVNGARTLAACPAPARLRNLNLCNSGLSDEPFSILAGSPLVRELRRLDLSYNHLTASGVEALLSASLPHLTVLDLSSNLLTEEAAGVLASLPQFGRLYTLDLRRTQLGDAGARALGTAGAPTGLRELDLSYTGIEDAGAEALAQSPRWPHLRTLSLEGNPIRGRTAAALIASPHLRGIRQLNLQGTNLGEKSRRALQRHFGPRVLL
jgi:uncharacterized protein (TIGR02996 family)